MKRTFGGTYATTERILKGDHNFFPPKLEVNWQLPSLAECLIDLGFPNKRDGAD
jgi:hypothetical protein